MFSNSLRVNKNQLLSAFSLALDLAENKPMEHARRTAYVALAIAREMKLPEDMVKNVYSAAFLHDIGIIEDYKFRSEDAKAHHQRVGSQIVRSLPFEPDVARFIRLHHAKWDGIGEYGPDKEEIPLGAQVVYLADWLDYHYDARKPYHLQKDDLLEEIRSRCGTVFNPQVAEALLRVAAHPQFWLDYTFHNVGEILAQIEPEQTTTLGMTEMERVAEAFAQIIDKKSKFTHNHSVEVARLAVALATEAGYGEKEQFKFKVAGLLHDLGKLAVPNQILDKPGKLNNEEFEIIKSHSYYSQVILGKVNGFEEISIWAGSHHETLNGKGYPKGRNLDEGALPERILAVCDVYIALTEDRPYRQSMTCQEAMKIINSMTENHKLCPQAVELLKKVI
ncbi:MAG: HD domain-containing protein [Clostridia bacterium]|nr:HD domain-containing protein [Clostridia bacterium]